MDELMDSLTLDSSIHPSDQAPKAGRKPPARRSVAAPEGERSPERSNPGERALSQQLQDELIQAGVYGYLLPEVAASGYSEDELRALLAWSQNDKPAIAPAVFITRLRLAAHAPAEYLLAPCKRCGLRGRHAPDCTGRYVMDDYAPG
jgi:hypothetical protein